jgi:hypothetical protein
MQEFHQPKRDMDAPLRQIAFCRGIVLLFIFIEHGVLALCYPMPPFPREIPGKARVGKGLLFRGYGGNCAAGRMRGLPHSTATLYKLVLEQYRKVYERLKYCAIAMDPLQGSARERQWTAGLEHVADARKFKLRSNETR